MSKKVTIKNILMILGGILIGAGIGYFSAKLLLTEGGGSDEIGHPLYIKLMMLPLCVVGFFIVIGFHELGHVFAGLSQNFNFMLLTVGPLMFEKVSDKVVFKWNTNVNTFGGLALCLPEDQINLAKRYAFFVAGGPLASMLLGILTAVPLMIVEIDRTHALGFLSDFFLLLISMMSFGIALVTIIPFHSGGFTSDGGKMLELLIGGKESELQVMLLSQISLASSGVRPAQFDTDKLLHALSLAEQSPSKPYLHAFLYSHYQDVKDLDKAAFHLDEYLKGIDGVPSGFKASVYLEKAWFEARHFKNVELAREYFGKEKFGPIIPKSQILRAEAAIAHAEGNLELAAAKAKEAINELPKLLDKGSAIAEREWLEEMLLEN